MGTPSFADASLQAIAAAGHEICGVFTQPDKPKNRGMKLEKSPVKLTAEKLGIPVYQPVKLRDGTALEIIRTLSPELICVVAYGRILPPDILRAAPFGCVNIHGSLLPKYRGAAPIQWTVLNGERDAGVTAMYLSEEMDAGDVIGTRKTEVLPGETAGELYERLSHVGASLLVDTVSDIEKGIASAVPQEHDKATFAPFLTKEMSPIDWNLTSREVQCKILGLDPWPGATSEWNGKIYKLFHARPGKDQTDVPAGTVLGCRENCLEVACGEGTVLIEEIQCAGGKRMSAADYLRGHTI